MKRRNKKYRPKCIPGTLPVIFALAPEKKTDLRLPYHLSLEALRNGKGGTLGHSIDMLPGELHESAFLRYCVEHKLTYSRCVTPEAMASL